MNQIQVLTILENVLGVYRQTGEHNYAFYCPHCKHYKQKLEINLETYNYHCWTCSPKLGGKNFFYLLKDLRNINQEQLDIIKRYTNVRKYVHIEKKKDILYLPETFKSMLTPSDSIEYKHALRYIRNRNISDADIRKYNIGYVDDGEYGGRIVIPSYTSNGELNYFIARSYTDSKLKYKNPKVSKDIILFESLISWNYPIVIVEGVFDAIAVKRNAIPILGKNISQTLKSALVLNKVKDVYVCLDLDAKDDALQIGKDLIGQLGNSNVYLVKLDKKDPADIGFLDVNTMIRKTPKFDFKSLIYTRLFE